MSARPNALPIAQITRNVLQLARLAARSKPTDKIKHDRALAQLKQLVENPNGQDGAYWQWSWTAFCRGTPERGILSITQVLKQHQSGAEEPPAKQSPAEEPTIDESPTDQPSLEPQRAQVGISSEPLERLTWRVNIALKKSDEHQIAAGLGLLELKKRITDKTSNEGKPWNWNWPLFVRGDRHHPPQIDLSYSQTQRLIGYVQADDPAAAIAAARGQEAARQREQRRTAHSHICERRMAAPAEPATPHQAVAEVHQLAQEASRSEIGGASQIDGATGERIIELTPAAERDLETLKTLYLAATDEVRLAFNAYTALERGDWQALATNPKLAAAAGELVREMSEAIRKLDAAA